MLYLQVVTAVLVLYTKLLSLPIPESNILLELFPQVASALVLLRFWRLLSKVGCENPPQTLELQEPLQLLRIYRLWLL